LGTGFTGQMTQPTLIIALKEIVVLRIRLQSNLVHPTMLQYYTGMQYTVRHKIIRTQKMSLSTVK